MTITEWITKASLYLRKESSKLGEYMLETRKTLGNIAFIMLENGVGFAI